MGTIVHPTDLSKTSHCAFEHALGLAFIGRHKLVILHIEPKLSREFSWSQFPHVRDTLSKWGFIASGVKATELQDESGLAVRKVNVVGTNPAKAVLEYLKVNPADLVVVGTHARQGLEAWLKKSVALSLADGIVQPMLFVREGLAGLIGDTGGKPAVDLVVPVDVEPDPQLAVDWAQSLSDHWNVPVRTLTTLHVGDSELSPPIVFRDLPGVKVDTVTNDGVPHDEILKFVDRRKADLVVMARAGPDKLSEKFLGSTTERIIRSASCPVLVLPAQNYV